MSEAIKTAVGIAERARIAAFDAAKESDQFYKLISEGPSDTRIATSLALIASELRALRLWSLADDALSAVNRVSYDRQDAAAGELQAIYDLLGERENDAEVKVGDIWQATRDARALHEEISPTTHMKGHPTQREIDALRDKHSPTPGGDGE